MRLPSGAFTENGKFFEAALRHSERNEPPDLVRAYEKIRSGIWSDNGNFHLVDAWLESDDARQVFKFRLIALEGDRIENASVDPDPKSRSPGRLIPSEVKLEVWKRDRGKCVQCAATDELHFDHILPFSKGGTSLKADNVQLLCARHNLAKSAKIE
jgi:hypothetical protein